MPPLARALLVVGLVLVAGGVWLIARERLGDERPAAEAVVAEPAPAAQPGADQPPAAPSAPDKPPGAPRALVSVPRSSGEVMAEAPPPPPPTGVPADGGAGADGGTTHRWRVVLRTAQNRRMKEADEIVFDQLGLSAGQRDAIRRINDDYSRRTETVAETLNAAAKVELDRGRRSAVADVLGFDLGRRFDSAESAVTIRLRGKYRRESGKMMMQR